MFVEALTYAVQSARLTVAPAAARSFVNRSQLPRSLRDVGGIMMRVDLAEIQHAPGRHLIVGQGRSTDPRRRSRYRRRRSRGSEQERAVTEQISNASMSA
jgi:hypothetical protein